MTETSSIIVVRAYGEPGSTFIQWKGTDLCADVHCLPPCEALIHVDAEMPWGGYVRCPECERVLLLGTRVEVTLAQPGEEFGVVDAFNDDH